MSKLDTDWSEHYIKKTGGKEYLADILMLSMCNCFVCGITSGSVGVMMMSDFEKVHAFNFGKYGRIGFY